ncbi:hypothetical protein K435DRAFT_852396 [Dendrothele bispora CBS 962.96]|uniref:Uncharacterized protein n=1 Tax=Dendrothele bispora (strain CBS 962.96) TaxID=1314807 RepID=A0A4S8MJX2_DENBC|nr:hypothetical protein K435DRAFT_852396 [Dendrothele bispora CBS 962.96]
MNGHARGCRGFPTPPPLPHGQPPPIAPFGHSRGIPMPPPGPPPFEFPPPPELGAYGRPTPFHIHVPGPPPPARSDRGRFRSSGAHIRFATSTIPPTEATATATDIADTPDATTTEAQGTVASTAPPPQVTRDNTIPNSTLPHPGHHHHRHHLRGAHYFSGLHTHHGGFHRHHCGHGRFGSHAHITVYGGSRIPLLVNMRRALRFSHRSGHGGRGCGLRFGRGRSFGYPYTGYPNPYYSFGWFASDDTEGGFDLTSDGARDGEEEKRREENARAGTESEHHQKDDQDREGENTRSHTLDFECLSPSLSEPSSESSLFTISDDGHEGDTSTGATRTRNIDNDPAAEEEDCLLLPPRSPSSSELDETSSVDSESNESNPDTTFVPRSHPRSHAHSRHHRSHHHPHNHGHHDGPHHRPSRLGSWHHFDWARAREAGLGGSGPGLGRGRGLRRGGHSHSHNHLHPRPYFRDYPPHPPPPYHNGPDFDNDMHPDFNRLLGLGIPPHGPFPPPSFSPTIDANNHDGDASLDFGTGFSFGSARGRGGRGGFRAGERGRGGRGGGGARGLGVGRQGN